MRTVAAVVSWVLTVSWMILIFLLSAQPAEESSEVSSSFTEVILSIVVPGYDDMSADEQTAILESWHDPIRKIAHLTEYAVLGGLLLVSLTLSRVTIKISAFTAAGVSLLYAISDELHQGFVEARGPGIGDVCIDFAGAVLGISVLCLGYWLIHRKKKEKISLDS